MVSRDDKRLVTTFISIVLLGALSIFAVAQQQPTGPDELINISDSRFSNLSPKTTDAEAGNVSEINMTAQSATKSWQGYYGNISGTITLEDASGNVFYDWSAQEPEGEIYASTNSTVNWGNVGCFGFNANGTSDINLTTEEQRYGINKSDVDGINETYDQTDHKTFYVGTNQQTGCPTTYTYQNSSSQSSNFQNVLLADNSTNSLIFTTLIENRDPNNDTDLIGYNEVPYDFQMLVAEDEHTQSAAGPTTYYFWVEIE